MVIRRTRTLPILLLLLAAGGLRAAPDTPRAKPEVISVVNRADAFAARREQVEPVVRAHGRARDADGRREITDRLVKEFGAKSIEVLIRYREPHLIPVFAKLVEHEDWSVRRLAIFGLQRHLAVSTLDGIVARLDDEVSLVREIAATTTAILHYAGKKHRKDVPKEERSALKGLGKRKKADLAALKKRLGTEENAYVKSSLRAAIEVMGKRPLIRIHEEQATGDAPVRFIPRLAGAQVNAYQAGSGYNRAGTGKLRPTRSWAYPVMLYPREIMTIGSDRPLVPLVKRGNSLHFGHDCGWFLEGSTIYAIADGVVRLVKSGGDWGGFIATEHMMKKGRKIMALNGHCGMWVFVKPGEKVVAGQALGQMGLSFSPENGGHGAHDHFGMYDGAFDAKKCYGRSGAGRSVKGWLVPPDFLTPLVDGELIAPESYK